MFDVSGCLAQTACLREGEEGRAGERDPPPPRFYKANLIPQIASHLTTHRSSSASEDTPERVARWGSNDPNRAGERSSPLLCLFLAV